MFNLFASFAEFERELISEKTKTGLAHAKSQERKRGRRPGLSKEAKNKAWHKLYIVENKPNMYDQDFQKELGISMVTYYRYLECAKKDKAAQLKKIKKSIIK